MDEQRVDGGVGGGDQWDAEARDAGGGFSGIAPPTTSEGVDLPAYSSWAKGVGICGIVYASLGLLGSCMTFGSAFAMQFVSSMVSSQPGGPQMSQAQQAQLDVSAQYAWMSMVLGPLMFAIAAWLLIASIGVVRCRSWSGRQTVLSCLARVAFGILSSVGGGVVMVESLAAMRAAPDYDPSMDGVVIASGIAGIGFGIVWSLLYPGFALVWFNRPKIKAEVRGWGGGSIEGDDRLGMDDRWAGATRGDH